MGERIFTIKGIEYWQPELNVAQDECLIELFSELDFNWENWANWDFNTIIGAVKGRGLFRKLLAIILLPRGEEFNGDWTAEEREAKENAMKFCPNSVFIPVVKDFFGSAGGWQGIFQNFMPGLAQPPEKEVQSPKRGKRG